jgi:glycosyltransferase involved in cell wall biosynthesis
MHGHYRGVYETGNAVDPREFLGIPKSARVILYFGQLRAYKNVPLLIEAFRQCRGGEDIRLVIAGAPVDRTAEAAIADAAKGDRRITIHARHIGDESVELYFRACDLVVLPYREIQNSGAALLGLSFNRPILVPDLGAMPELQQLVGPRWVKTFCGTFNADTLQDALNGVEPSHEETCTPLDTLHWGNIADQTFHAYNEILSNTSLLRR